MKIRVTEIECDANEIRQSNTLADSIANVLRGCFNRCSNESENCEEMEEDEDEV